jgi:hypothetical protein
MDGAVTSQFDIAGLEIARRGRTHLADSQREVIWSQHRIGSTNILADWQFCQFARAAEVLIISIVRTIASRSPEDALQLVRTSKTRVN